MKELKLTIAGEVKTFDLPEDGEYKCEVTETYVPKAGDCVIMKNKEYNVLYWCKLTDVTTAKAYFNIVVTSKLDTSKNGYFYINNTRTYTKITPEELKAKYAEAGYDWDYESDTIKPIKWIPKDGDTVWYLTELLEVSERFYYKDNYDDNDLLKKGFLFPTEAECQKFADHCMSYINNKKE